MEQHAMSHHLQSKLLRGSLYSFSHSGLRLTGLKDSLERRPGSQDTLALPCANQSLQIQAAPCIVQAPACVAAADADAPASQVQAMVASPFPPPADLVEVEDSDGSSMLQNVVFVRLVHSRIAHLKGVDLPAAGSKKLQATDICVTIHRGALLTSAQGGEGRFCVGVDPEAARGISHEVSVLSLLSGAFVQGHQSQGLDVLKESMRQWSHDSEILFGLKDADISAEASSLLKSFVLKNAFPQCPHEHCMRVEEPIGEAEANTALLELRHAGAIEKRQATSDASLWSLTTQGALHLKHMYAAKRPQKVFKPAAELAALPLEDLEERSSWELLQILQHRGWNLQRGQKEKAKKKLMSPVTARSVHKVFYMYTLQCQSKDNVAYLRALCASEHLFDQGCLAELHHGQLEKYYLNILEGHDDDPAADFFSDTESIESISFVTEEDAESRVDGDAPSLAYSPSIGPASCSPAKCISSESEKEAEPSPGKSSEPREGAAHQEREETLLAEVASPNLRPPPAPFSDHAVPAAKQSRRKDTVAETHPDSFDWGPFRFTFTGQNKRPPHGQWQANCPYHRLNDRTGCTRAMQAGPSEETKQEAKRKLQTWCLLAPHHARKRHHTSAYLTSSDVLPQEILNIRLSALTPPIAKPPTDEELDAAETQDAKNTAPPRAKAKSRAKANSQAKAHCKKAMPKDKASKKRKAEVLSDQLPEAAAATVCGSGAASTCGPKTAPKEASVVVSAQSSVRSHESRSSSSSSSSGSTSSSGSGSTRSRSSSVGKASLHQALEAFRRIAQCVLGVCAVRMDLPSDRGLGQEIKEALVLDGINLVPSNDMRVTKGRFVKCYVDKLTAKENEESQSGESARLLTNAEKYKAGEIWLSPTSSTGQLTVLAEGSNIERLNCSVCSRDVQCSLTIETEASGASNASLQIVGDSLGLVEAGAMTCIVEANGIPIIGGADIRFQAVETSSTTGTATTGSQATSTTGATRTSSATGATSAVSTTGTTSTKSTTRAMSSTSASSASSIAEHDWYNQYKEHDSCNECNKH
eukprot:s1919_g9.t1